MLMGHTAAHARMGCYEGVKAKLPPSEGGLLLSPYESHELFEFAVVEI
jgi:hypothetical protein